MRTIIALAIGRAVRKLIRLFRHGGGSALPGTLAAKIQPKLFDLAIQRMPHGLVVVTGSSGKSSTTKFLTQILEQQGMKVFTNPSTANIEQGLFSAVLQGGAGISLPRADIAVIEMDEAFAAKIGAPMSPRLCVLTNIMDEQLDRFRDSGFVQSALRTLSDSSSNVVANGNDPSLAELPTSKTKFFGLSPNLAAEESAPRYSISPRQPIDKLDYQIVDTDPLTIETPNRELALRPKIAETHMMLNFVAAIAAADQLVTGLDIEQLQRTASELEGVYGRDSAEVIEGVETRILLVQNRESFRLNLLKAKSAEQIFMAIGTDVKDPSWLWGVDFSNLKNVDILTGHHAIAMKYRLQSCRVSTGNTILNFDTALRTFLSSEAPREGERVVIVTADTFRRMKRALGLGS